MRCMDFRGLKLFKGAREEMCSRMVAIAAGWKILGLSSRVMRRVLDGGAGDDKGGREEKSRDRGDRDLFIDNEEGDAGGEEDCILFWRGEGCGCSIVLMVAVDERCVGGEMVRQPRCSLECLMWMMKFFGGRRKVPCIFLLNGNLVWSARRSQMNVFVSSVLEP